MTHLRQMMLEELERRNYAPRTIECYIQTVKHFSRYFKRPPDHTAPTCGLQGASPGELASTSTSCSSVPEGCRDCLRCGSANETQAAHTRGRG